MQRQRSQDTKRIRIDVTGSVQGVGFRPFIYRLANQLKLAGWVRNTPEGTSMEIEGNSKQLQKFQMRMETELPPSAFIQTLKKIETAPCRKKGFTISGSSSETRSTTPVLTDLALCGDCLREMNDPSDRRYRYPFITCTNCGPRYTIITGLPYDRPQTTMKDFLLCAKCTEEYTNPLDRRFHAQPLACPDCGPELSLLDRSGGLLSEKDEALTAAAEAIKEGRIIALKGLGGFHIVCDARNRDTVKELRRRKHRPSKPFAVMMPSLEAVAKHCLASRAEEKLLASPQSPIVILDIMDTGELAPEIAPGNPSLGVMLPYTPLHHLLMEELGFPVIATSGNRSGEPICTGTEEALERLEDIANVFLTHNRPIYNRNDDSVVKFMGGKPVMLRRARGYAPLPVTPRTGGKETPEKMPVILATGSQLKNTVALAVNQQIITGPHIGNLETPQAIDGHKDAIFTLCGLYETGPEIVAHDKHPEYFSTQSAESLKDVKKYPVQHHYAHALSCMTDNDLEGPCLAIVWDGAGYGDDGTVWGGEFLKITGSGYERAGHLHPFRLPGGDMAAREPWRVAISLLAEAGEEMPRELPGVSENQIKLVRQILDKDINCPICTSAGRLFDGISCLLKMCAINTYEGEAAMSLEFASSGETENIYPYSTSGGILDWREMVKNIADDPPTVAAAKFHNTLAEAAKNMAKDIGERHVILTGGCFQNKLLLEKLSAKLETAGLVPFWHSRIPPNDGGISTGQIAAVIKEITNVSGSTR